MLNAHTDTSTFFSSVLKKALKELCSVWRIEKIALFGSALRDDFKPESDLDLLLEFKKGEEPGYFQWVQLHQELETLLQRKVDLVTRKGLLNSLNTQRAQAILNTCQELCLDG